VAAETAKVPSVASYTCVCQQRLYPSTLCVTYQAQRLAPVLESAWHQSQLSCTHVAVVAISYLAAAFAQEDLVLLCRGLGVVGVGVGIHADGAGGAAMTMRMETWSLTKVRPSIAG
jgi:hypothetical protein